MTATATDKTRIFHVKERLKMQEKILQVFRKHKTNCVLFTNAKEIFYLTGAQFDGFWLLFVRDKTYAICSKMTENQVREHFKNKNINIHAVVSFYKTVSEILKQNKTDSLLIDPQYINAADFFLINEELNFEGINIKNKVGILNSLRIVKDADEIENLKIACKIVSKVCNTIKSELKPGLSELDIHYRILELFAKNKVMESFTPIVASGENSANPHHRSSTRKMTENDIVMMDMGCVHNGYCSDLTRTYFLDKIDTGRRRVFDIVKSSQDAVIKDIKSGLPISWADKTARSVIEEAGYKDKFIHNTGHGVGVEIHEVPSLASTAEGFFLTHMAVTVEPGIYIENEFGVRIEDTILIKKDSCEVLTSAAY
ncbi:proline dipeptidase [Endomicrobiia bacterium]|nr:proline dipeptidase [Endomicrobiia bacterium]